MATFRIPSEGFFLIFSVAFFVLYLGQLQGVFRASSASIAMLSYSSGTVRRLSQGQLLWDRTQEGDRFAMGDTIATSEMSFARLLFHDGSKLEMEPGSLVILRPEKEELKLVFLSGNGRLSLHSKTAEKITVQKTKSSPAVPVVLSIQESDQTLKSKPLETGGEVMTTGHLPKTPKILGPDDEVYIDFNQTKFLELRYGDPVSATEPGVSYEVRIETLGQSAAVRIIQSAQPSFKLGIKDLPSGEYSWSVRTVDQTGKRSRASISRRIRVHAHVDIRQPKLFPPVVERGR